MLRDGATRWNRPFFPLFGDIQGTWMFTMSLHWAMHFWTHSLNPSWVYSCTHPFNIMYSVLGQIQILKSSEPCHRFKAQGMCGRTYRQISMLTYDVIIPVENNKKNKGQVLWEHGERGEGSHHLNSHLQISDSPWTLRAKGTDPFTTLALLLVYSGMSPGRTNQKKKGEWECCRIKHKTL